ncbi:MAG TPA: ATP-binding cassette domain-containing protein [Streptosporangiaceae bacterium]|nr:ATP-binding cassette domain-containing protein [Streptosporangiaceae bacterium]
MPGVLLEARGLRYVRDGQLILAGVDVTVRPGESLAVTGPSGSGKSSMLAIISGLAAPTAGEVFLNGQPLSGFAGPASGVAVVLQGYGLVSLLTAAGASPPPNSTRPRVPSCWAGYSQRFARAAHQPWPLYRARALAVDDGLVTAAGLPAPDGEPLVHYSPGVDVRIGLPESYR